MIDTYKKVVFKNYANFNGRARRTEYWLFSLAQFCIFISLLLVGAMIGAGIDKVFNNKDGMPISVIAGVGPCAIYLLATVVPSLAVVVRRLHDSGKSGWFILFTLIPYVGGIIGLVFYCTEGTRGQNQYGADPKNPLEDLNEIGKE